MQYELLNAEGYPVKPNTKVAFCLADIAKGDSNLSGFPTAPAYDGCDPNQRTTYVSMGTSVGWQVSRLFSRTAPRPNWRRAGRRRRRLACLWARIRT
jgi:hypothetical protein